MLTKNVKKVQKVIFFRWNNFVGCLEVETICWPRAMNPVIYQVRIQSIFSEKFSLSKHLSQRSSSVGKCKKKINKRTSFLLESGHSDSDMFWLEQYVWKSYWKINSSLLEHEEKTTPAQPSSVAATTATQPSTRKLLPLFYIRIIILFEIFTAKTNKPFSKAPQHETSEKTTQHITRKPHDSSKELSQPEHGTRKSDHPTQSRKSNKLSKIERYIWMLASAA